MKKLYFLLLTLCAFSFANAQLINEFQPNPVGSDPAMVSVELSGTAGTTFSGFLISIENDGANGTVDRSTAVSGTFDANGLSVVMIPDLENPSFTFVFCSIDPLVGTDLDVDNDGTIDSLAALGTVYDAIGIPDSTLDATTMYGTQLGGTDFAYTGGEPQSVFRDGLTGDWYAVNDPAGTDVYDIAATAVPGTDFDVNPTVTPSTFAAVNPSAPTASTEDLNTLEISIFPNPVSNGIVTIKTTSNETVTASAFDILGKQVITQTLTNNTLNVSNLESGVYILKLDQNGASTTKKLVIQ